MALALSVAGAGAFLAGRGAPAAGTALILSGAAVTAVAALPGGLPIVGRRRSRTPAVSAAGASARPGLRRGWIPAGVVLAAVAVAGTGGNRISPAGALAWAASIGALLVGLRDPGETAPPAPRLSRRGAAALVGLTLLGGALRLGTFASAPPEPTSDHVEKALDALRISGGARPVFCPANGGREPLQMYLLALLAALPGFGLDLRGLTLLTALEGTLTIPLLFLAGRELARPRGARSAENAGIATAALGALCGWHVVLSRLGLRIVLFPAATLLLLVSLLRAVRDGRRRDWLAAGAVAGLSLYTYQSARFLPLLVAAAAFLAARRTPLERRRLLASVSAAALVAAACAAPLARYAVEFPGEFWTRARTRLLGDGAAADPAAALRERLPALAKGVGPALGALHVRGDVAWFQNAPGRPFLDPGTSALLAAGLGVAAARAFRRRDRGALLVPCALVLLLLPSASAAAFPIENPSATRASGALAPALLLAGAGLERAGRALRAWGAPLSAPAFALLLLPAGVDLAERASRWEAAYAAAALPHRALAGEVGAFVGEGGPFDNVFVVGVRHGADDRAVAMEAGFVGRSPGLQPHERPLAAALAVAACGRDPRRPRFDPARPLLFLLAPGDAEGLSELRALFPAATFRSVDVPGRREGFVAVRAASAVGRRS
jgi:hypothetical protein